MKKRRLFLSIVLMFAIVCFSACKKKSDDTTPELTSPTINVSITNRKYYVGESLQDIKLIKESSDTAGTLEWVTKSYTLVLGENECYWTFTPKDKTTYSSKTGKIVITAVERPVQPEIEVSIVNGVYYAGQRLSVVPLEYSPSTIQGTLKWNDPNAILAVGQNEYTWKFVPADQDKYVEYIKDRITVVAIEPVVSNVSIKTYPTKMNYNAFEQFDPTGMVVEAINNVGERFEVSGWTWKYKTGESLFAGNNLIEINYGGFKCDLAVNNVAKLVVHEPTFIAKDYTGESLSAEFSAPSDLYTFEPVSQTNANTYDIKVTLVDTQNYEWYLDDNKASASVVAKFIINKVSLVVTQTNVDVEYDGYNHFATVSTTGYDTIYYSLEDLGSKEEWIAGGEDEAIAFKNVVDNQRVYYYIVGDNNHLDASGWLTVKIAKQEIELTAKYCYTIYTGEIINYPESYLTIYDDAGNAMTGGKENITYYVSYPAQKTSAINGQALYEGGAPKAARDNPYYIVYTYMDDNVSAFVTAQLFIDSADNIFYAKNGEDEFAYKTNPTEYGSTELCEYYLEFELGTNAETGLLEITYISKIGAGVENNGEGNLIYKNGYKLVDATGAEEAIEIYKNTGNDDPNPTSIKIVRVDKTLTKWIIPNYLGTYAAQTIDDANTAYDEKYSYVTIENSYGTIVFTYEYNFARREMNGGIVYGGSGVVEGVTKYGTYTNNGEYHQLKCYRTGDEFVGNVDNTFYIRWNTTGLDGEPITDPQTITIVDNSNNLKNIINDTGFDITYTKIS